MVTTLAELLPDKASDELRDRAGLARLAAKRDNTRLLAMAAGKPGSPFTRDGSGRLRRNGRFAAVK